MSTHHGYRASFTFLTAVQDLTVPNASTVNEFPFIRVDNFDGDTNCDGKKPHFYLLTHAHTDHIRGMSAL